MAPAAPSAAVILQPSPARPPAACLDAFAANYAERGPRSQCDYISAVIAAIPPHHCTAGLSPVWSRQMPAPAKAGPKNTSGEDLMISSRDRILTTHVGSLPRNDKLSDLLLRQEAGEAYDAAEMTAELDKAVAHVVDKQAA